MELTISTPRLAAARILPRTPRAFYRTAINAFFFVMGMVFASWAVRIPDIKAALQMSDAALGSVLLAAPLGEMLSIAPTAWLIGRFRSRRVIMLGLMLMPCALLSLALAGSPHWLAAALLGFGFANNMLNISLNAQAVGVETLYGRSIMATFHGMWSLGGVAGCIIGSIVAPLGVALLPHFAAILVITLATLCCLRTWTMPREVRIGATKTIGEFVLAGPLSRYIRDTRDNVTIEVDNTEVLLHQLEHEALDFAFVEGAFDKNRYGYRLYRKAPFVGMCRRDHPFAGRTVTLQDLRGQSVVLREEGSGTRAILENALAEYGFGVDLFSREIRSSNFSLILRFVSEGSGITFAYAPVAEGRKDIAFFHLDCLGEEREFHIVYLKGTKVFPLIREVLGEDAPDLGEP